MRRRRKAKLLGSLAIALHRPLLPPRLAVLTKSADILSCNGRARVSHNCTGFEDVKDMRSLFHGRAIEPGSTNRR